MSHRMSAPPLVPVMSRAQRIQLSALLGLWLFALGLLWRWWARDTHVVGWPGFAASSLIVAWATILPAYYFFFVWRMQRPDPALPPPAGLRVAMVVTKVPSEPFALVRETLEAMLAQGYPHDTWLADEDPALDTLAWCREHGVCVSTRKGVTDYHRQTWPRRTRCKEGNLAYFYDTYGYERYDVVVQLDADQKPAAGYLEAMLRPFADPAVGYVSAPSICDVNAERSWAARARLYAEGTLHGSLQAGYNAGWVPLCIGSHYAVRTAALREIGGLGPELAEDHSTTLLMNAHGWRGVHALDAEAHGLGPATFEDCMTQEYQWSRSVTTILLQVTPRYWRRLPARAKAQFLFAQLWYPSLGLVMLTASMGPVVALATGIPWVSVSYVEFVVHKLPVTALALLTVWWVRRRGWLRPRDSRLLTWETALFQLARWPWVLLGAVVALASVAGRSQREFRVTPKGDDVRPGVSLRVLAPYLGIALLSGAVAALIADPGTAGGYYYLTITTSLSYATLALLVTVMSVVEGRRATGDGASHRADPARARRPLATTRAS